MYLDAGGELNYVKRGMELCWGVVLLKFLVLKFLV